MKRLWMVGVLLAASVAFAVPPVIPFQGRITLADGVSGLDGASTVIFTLYTTATGNPGDIVYTETQTVTFDKGAFSVSIGATSPLMASLFKTHRELYLGAHIGGDPQELRPLFKIGTAPYAIHSVSSDVATSVTNSAGAALSCAVGEAIVGADGGWSCSPVPNAYTKTEADARFARTTACYWRWVSGGVDAGTVVTAQCDVGDWALSGGCDVNNNGASIVESFPRPSTGDYKAGLSPWPIGVPASDPVNPVIDQWQCRVTDGGIIDAAYVMCCPPR